MCVWDNSYATITIAFYDEWSRKMKKKKKMMMMMMMREAPVGVWTKYVCVV